MSARWQQIATDLNTDKMQPFDAWKAFMAIGLNAADACRAVIKCHKIREKIDLAEKATQ